MAFAENNLSKLGNLKRVKQHWDYNAGADAVAAVTTAGYFNDARGFLKEGDRIDIRAASNAQFRVLTVTAVPTAGNVTVVAAVGNSA